MGKGVYIFGSEDHGHSKFLLPQLLFPGDESKIIELPDGKWMVNSRVNISGLRYVHLSEDHGINWVSSPDSSLVDPGCNASLIDLHDPDNGQLLIFSNARSDSKREKLSVMVSADQGMNWYLQKIIYDGSSAYSSMTITQDGQVGILFERDEYSKVSYAKFPNSHPDN